MTFKNHEELFKALLSKCKIREISWYEDAYLYLNDQGMLVDQDGDCISEDFELLMYPDCWESVDAVYCKNCSHFYYGYNGYVLQLCSLTTAEISDHQLACDKFKREVK